MAQLYENFNTTNQTSPHFEAHLNFAKPISQSTCGLINVLNLENRCNHAKTACLEHVYIFEYTSFYYCNLYSNDVSRTLGIALLIGICIFQFWLEAITTAQFFCPALTEVCRMLHMNENVAGATILAFGNGAPDFFTSIVGLWSDSRHIYTETSSATLFVSVFVAGVIVYTRPFSIEPAFFLRDSGFVLLYTIYVDYVVKANENNIRLVDSICMSLIYLVYILVIIVDQYLLLRKRRLLMAQAAKMEAEKVSDEPIPMLEEAQRLPAYKSTMGMFDDDPPPKEEHLWWQLFQALNSLHCATFKKRSHVVQLYIVLQWIPTFILRLLIPRINLEDSEYQWSKLLCSLQFVLTPTFVTFAFWQTKSLFLNIPVFIVVAVVCVPLCVYAYLHTRVDVIPDWYHYMTIMSIISCVFVIYAVAREIIVVLETLGLALKRSNTFIGCTFFTWGNGLGDLITNLALARQGYPRMAYAACFGAPVFSCFVSVALPLLYKTIVSPTGVTLNTEGTIGENTSVLVIIGCSANVLYALTTNFMLRRNVGLLGIIIYILFLVLVVANEFQLLHSYGTDHLLDSNRYELEFGVV
ncbi:putative sodium/calcium exchanger 7 [Scaptodrosophila lebanonensis]|uniref:Sodium/calcium exchanger 7 n=1 Tax=Drosophila lebanonensis TaxID=7225 RepID=A0A6J2TMH5_DROLE|nr:putative sodium/calcium exchanger 7 [Scaptodrosophila lebanonensis]